MIASSGPARRCRAGQGDRLRRLPAQAGHRHDAARVPARSCAAAQDQAGAGGGRPGPDHRAQHVRAAARGASRILLADDNPVNCRLAVLMLEKAGHQIDVVNDGALAVEALRGKDYDLVLMDVQMPGVDGLEATRRIRALPAARAGVPVIAITANAMAGDEQRCLAAGMNDYVTKPIDRARLLGKVAQWGQGAAPAG